MDSGMSWRTKGKNLMSDWTWVTTRSIALTDWVLRTSTLYEN